MAIVIKPVQTSDPATVGAFVEVGSAVCDYSFPKWRLNTPRMAALMLDVPLPGVRHEFYVAWKDGEPVGRVVVDLSLKENLDVLSADVWVIPSARRQGIGTKLYEFCVDLAAANERKRLFASTIWPSEGFEYPDPSGMAFAGKLGYQPSLVDHARRLDLTQLDEQVLEGLLAKAKAKATDYTVVQWAGLPPGEYADDLAYLDSRLHTDAPMGDLNMEAPKIDATRMRAYQKANLAREKIGFHTAAVHAATGRLVAWTTITKEKSLDWHGFQQITIVDPDHRGNRLGALVKVENLRYLRTAEPAVTAIDTFNAADNTYMIAINEAMGFKPLYAFQNWQRDI
jgi:GNAT superfamily N-acetyltransferase